MNTTSTIDGIVAFYNIGWDSERLKEQSKHEETLSQDLRTALFDFNADLVLLSECGKIVEGLDETLWLPMLRRICGPGFTVRHQSHYTSIVGVATMKVTQQPTLKGPLSSLPGHEYRMCQHLQVVMNDSVPKPIDIVHSPASMKHPLTPTLQEHILH